MKTIRFSMFTLLFISFFSCSKDEAAPPKIYSADMTGEWNLENLDYEGTTQIIYGDIDITSEFSGITTESSAVIDFKSDGSYLSQGAYTIALTIEGFTQSYPLDVSSGTGDWYIEGDRMILSEGFVKMSTGQELTSEPGEMIIDELTANKMVLSFSNETTVNQNGYESIVNVSGYYIFTK